MIENGHLIVLVSQTPSPRLAVADDLSRLVHDGSLRLYFGCRTQFTSEEKALIQARNSTVVGTIIVVERGFFPVKQLREEFKDKIRHKAGIPPKHILFGEDYASGYHHIILKINELCG